MSTLSLALGILHVSNFWFAILKRTLSVSIPFMKAPFNLNVQDIGDCSSNFSICYGSFKLIGGIFSDYIPAEWVFSLGLLLGSAVNFAIASISGGKARFLVWLWGMNGLLQGAGGPALSKMIIDFLPESSRSYTWSSLMNVSLGFS